MINGDVSPFSRGCQELKAAVKMTQELSRISLVNG
jgi:hypothetical protein